MRTKRQAPPATATCAACGYGHDDDAVACLLCGALLGRPGSASARPMPVAEPVVTFESVPPPEPTIVGVPASLAFLVLGAVLAPIFTWTPILHYMGTYSTCDAL